MFGCIQATEQRCSLHFGSQSQSVYPLPEMLMPFFTEPVQYQPNLAQIYDGCVGDPNTKALGSAAWA
jgi:hypothetical protein